MVSGRLGACNCCQLGATISDRLSFSLGADFVTVGSIRERLLWAVQNGEVSTETSAMKGCSAMKASSFFFF